VFPVFQRILDRRAIKMLAGKKEQHYTGCIGWMRAAVVHTFADSHRSGFLRPAVSSTNSLERVSKIRFVPGHDFSRAEKGRKNKGF
jgi:hypothetical protein